MIEKTKPLTEEIWKYDQEIDGTRRGKIGLQEFSSVLQSLSESFNANPFPLYNFSISPPIFTCLSLTSSNLPFFTPASIFQIYLNL